MSPRELEPDVPAGAEFVAGARVMRLLAGLVDSGPTAAVFEAWSVFPELAEIWPGSGDADADAATHQEIFGFGLLPYAGVFLDDVQHEGRCPDEVAHRYRDAGFDPESDDLRPDHLATELRFLAHLLEAGPRGAAEAAGFLDGHLLAWLPPFAFAAERSPVYGPVVRFLLDWVLEQRRRIALRLGIAATAARALPMDPTDSRSIIEDDRTGVREIASFLTTPVHCGFYVGRSDIALLSHDARAPGGFGGRRLMMENLLRSAAHYDGLDTVFDRLDALAEDNASRWADLLDDPGVGPWAVAWRERIATTRGVLREMRERLRGIE